jgi:hypothetical protein
MSTKTRQTDIAAWIDADSREPPQAGYEAHVREKIALGQVDAEAGRVTPLRDVFKEFGLE